MDFGFTVSPLAINQVYPLGDKLYVAKEIVAHGISNERIPEFLDSILPDRGQLVIADSEDLRLIDYLNSQGFVVRAARKPPHSVLAGIKHLNGFDTVVSPDCPITLSEFRRLRWQTEKSGQIIENVNPIGDRHCLDAIRYACQDVFPGPAVTDDDDDEDWDGGVFYIRPWG